ncbi:MAG TPA: cysteine desulfurase family protein [Clostridia bacterium]|nr:cysteine desulfurase family protein [Clostridia bacterium]
MAIYFDNSATTKPCSNAANAVKMTIEECYGNPSSLHFLGINAHNELESARKSVSNLLGCAADNLYFSSSGTNANNEAIFGTYERLKREGNTIVTTEIEHPSVLMPIKKLKELFGVNVIYLSYDKYNGINEDELLNAITSDTILVSIMYINNETGAILPVSKIRTAVKKANAPAIIHSDCIQAFGKLRFTPKTLGADLVSISSHKIHGPKGAGALYIKNKNKIKPQVLGGGQENGVFSGTEPMPAIMGFAAAADCLPDIEQTYQYISSLKKRLTDNLSGCDNIVINSPINAVPYIVNLSILTLKSQPIVNYLSDKGICVSAGSACTKGKRSQTLTSMGLSSKIIDSAVRISFSRYNTLKEVDLLSEELYRLAKRI